MSIEIILIGPGCAGKGIFLKRADYNTWAGSRELRIADNPKSWNPLLTGRTIEQEKEFYQKNVDGETLLLYGIYIMQNDRKDKLIGLMYAFNRMLAGEKGPQQFEILKPGGSCEIGIHIFDKQSRGKGYAAEACKLFMEHLKNKYSLEKTVACIYSSNLGSINLFKKLGYNQTGSQDNKGYVYLIYEYPFPTNK